jgi:hypothetical protein
VKPARGMAIRFHGSAIARTLEADRLRFALPRLRYALHRFFTRMEHKSVSVMDLYMIVSACFDLFVVRSEVHSSSIVLCNLPQIKI